ncbi:transcriptional regulator, AsnC family protein [Rhodobacterales bacterium HTCC2255]|jgi:Lrp/AsnC family leucine-responsive transcriptional regulator|nr:transcriptional regulator, AsnC family protein [Rhodobacterales bacterium HTCC2255]|tara:strand:+ start:1419 stop:1898 length:480 start_codon:yes stop_codon:yes gene_type:complete
MKENIDNADAMILNLLQEDSKLGLDTLAYETGLSVASVQRRLKSLRARKIILREIAIVDPAKVNLPMSFIVMVELERERIDQIDAFIRRANNEPQVQQCYYVTGDADFCLICVAKSMDDFEDLTQRLFFENSNVRKFRTSVAMGRKKVGLQVPVLSNQD